MDRSTKITIFGGGMEREVSITQKKSGANNVILTNLTILAPQEQYWSSSPQVTTGQQMTAFQNGTVIFMQADVTHNTGLPAVDITFEFDYNFITGVTPDFNGQDTNDWTYDFTDHTFTTQKNNFTFGVASQGDFVISFQGGVVLGIRITLKTE